MILKRNQNLIYYKCIIPQKATIIYSIFDYYYPDLFPVEDTIDNGFDKITESHFNFIFTLRYLF